MDDSQSYGALLCVALTASVIWAALKLHLSSLHGRRRKYITKDRAQCAQIIAGSVLNGAKNTLSRLEARARANTRLSHAFGIDNAFTTENTEWHSEYRTKVNELIRPDWDMATRDAIGLEFFLMGTGLNIASESGYGLNSDPGVDLGALHKGDRLYSS
jgi:hypothetical protein